jgi:CheY-like chemotaxis protein
MYVHAESNSKIGTWKGKNAIFIITRNVQDRMAKFQSEMSDHFKTARRDANRYHAMTLAHDFRTCLSIFDMGWARIKCDAAEYDDICVATENCLWYMKYIINRTIDSCRTLQGEKLIPRMTSVDAEEIIKEVSDRLSSLPRSVTLNIEFPEYEIFVRADESWLKSCLASLLVNAFENTMTGSVTAEVRIEGDWTVFKIIDTGVGIFPNDIDKLFSPFVKLSNKISPEHGMGLGLYDCAWRIRTMGGVYGVVPNRPAGSIFYFKLPNRRSVIKSSSKLSLSEREWQTLKVLIVDDSSVFRQLLKASLAARGFSNMKEAEDGLQALIMMKEEHYDLILMDLMMPVMKGDESIIQYKKWESESQRFPSAKFIIMSADVMNDSTVSHADYFMSKPIDMNLLTQIVSEMFQKTP